MRTTAPRLRRLAIAYVAVLGACGSDSPGSDSSSAAPASASTTIDAALVDVVAVYEGLAFYPACGNETLLHDGVTWHPIMRAGSQPMVPELQDRVDAVLAVEREPWSPPDPQGLARIAPPGPGDDVGTMAVWADGVARWVSDSGTLDVWMVDDEIEDTWIC